MNYLQDKYISFVGSRLRNFHKKSSVLYNFSCPICNDSQKNKHKARAYLFERNGDVWFVCHNCNAPIGNFDNFLKKFDSYLYSEYVGEKYSTKEKVVEQKFEAFTFAQKTYDVSLLSGLVSVANLDDIDPVKVYVRSRRIPEQHFDKLFDCYKFKSFTNNLLPGKFSEKSLKYEERRLLIPFFDEDKKMFAYAGRSLDPKSDLRYINIVLDESKPKIFGIDRWNKKEYTYVVEGPIDSLFLPNCVATAGGILINSFRDCDKESIVIVYDNEPFSIETKHKIQKAIDEGFQVCIWPENLQFKDINAMILGGMSIEKIVQTIKDNTFSGLAANLKLVYWNRK